MRHQIRELATDASPGNGLYIGAVKPVVEYLSTACVFTLVLVSYGLILWWLFANMQAAR